MRGSRVLATVRVFLLESPELHEAERRRIEATKGAVLAGSLFCFAILVSQATGACIYPIFDYLSLHLAVRNGVEANPVPTIEAFKTAVMVCRVTGQNRRGRHGYLRCTVRRDE